MARQQFSPDMASAIRRSLEASWSHDTSVCFNPTIAPLSYGQCAPTAVVIHETFGGDILKTEVRKLHGGSVRHFYNRIDGQRYDFTSDQFSDIPDYWEALEYEDLPSSVEDAMTEMLPGQLQAMRAAFNSALKDPDGE